MMTSLFALLLAAASAVNASSSTAKELARLEGHSVTVTSPTSYRIDDIAGEGAPVVGRVEMRDGGLFLVALDGANYRLTGPLAIPRIAGPGYKVWVIGAIDGSEIRCRRLGILARPS